MAPPADLREWIALLEREGELVRIGAEVDPYLEVTEIVERTVHLDASHAASAPTSGSSRQGPKRSPSPSPPSWTDMCELD